MVRISGKRTVQVKISSEAKVKLETLTPKVARILQRQFESLRSAETRIRLEAEGKIKRLHGLPNTYSLTSFFNHLVVFIVEENDLTISDIVNVSLLDYIRRTTENKKTN